MFGTLYNTMSNMRVVLASSSQQRAELLKKTRLQFEICPSNFEENLDKTQYPISEYVEATALGKVEDVYERLKNDTRPADLIIGVDTMVSHNGNFYGKPKTKKEAFLMIKDLTQSRLPHFVYTGVVLRYRQETVKFTEVTSVHMKKLTDEEILAYVETEEPMGKAGGYGIQKLACTFITRIEGDYNNVIGLPLCRIVEELKKLILNDFSQLDIY